MSGRVISVEGDTLGISATHIPLTIADFGGYAWQLITPEPIIRYGSMAVLYSNPGTELLLEVTFDE